MALTFIENSRETRPKCSENETLSSSLSSFGDGHAVKTGRAVVAQRVKSPVTLRVEPLRRVRVAGDGHTVGRCAPSRCRCFDDGRGRVAQPLAFALTDPGGRISRTRLFPRVPASYPRLRPCASDVWNGQTEVCRQDLELRPAHAPTFMTVPSQTTQPGPTHFAVEGKRRLRPIRKDLKGRIATRWRSGLQSVESTRCKPLKWRLWRVNLGGKRATIRMASRCRGKVMIAAMIVARKSFVEL